MATFTPILPEVIVATEDQKSLPSCLHLSDQSRTMSLVLNSLKGTSRSEVLMQRETHFPCPVFLLGTFVADFN